MTTGGRRISFVSGPAMPQASSWRSGSCGGLVGAGHARFSDFVTGPSTALTYLAELLRGTARRFVGHSPAGAAMVIARLLCLSGTVWTGPVAYGDGGNGPLAGARGLAVTGAHAEEHEASAERVSGRGKEGGEGAAGKLHGTLANLTLGLVIPRILGVGLASLVPKENLVSAMITGRKRPGNEA